MLEIRAIVGLRALGDALVRLRHSRALAEEEVRKCVNNLVEDLEVLNARAMVEAIDMLALGLQTFAANHSQWLWKKPFYEALVGLSRAMRAEYGSKGLVDQDIDSEAAKRGEIPGQLVGVWNAALMENKNVFYDVLDSNIGLTKKPTDDG